MRKSFGVLISGNGSNLQALIDSRDINISVVISSSPKAYGILRARRAGIPVEILPKGQGESWILETLKKYSVKNLFLAGFMKILTADFIQSFKKSGGHIINIHPSLLPLYKGLHAFESALEAGDKKLGITVHHVIPAVDSGDFILQRSFEPPQGREKGASKLLLHIHEQNVLKQSLKGNL